MLAQKAQEDDTEDMKDRIYPDPGLYFELATPTSDYTKGRPEGRHAPTQYTHELVPVAEEEGRSLEEMLNRSPGKLAPYLARRAMGDVLWAGATHVCLVRIELSKVPINGHTIPQVATHYHGPGVAINEITQTAA